MAESEPRRVALFVFIDAFGWELLKALPFLDDVLVHKQPLGSIFGYSSTCDPTILTGLLPRDHGHFSFFYYDPAKSPFRAMKALGVLPRSITGRGRVRHWMSRLIKKFYGYTGYFQIYAVPFDRIGMMDYSEKRDIYERDGINSGARTIFDELRDRKVPFHMSDWRAGERTNLDSLAKALGEGQIRFAYLYMAAMDAILHADGKDSQRVRDKIKWYEAEIRRLLEIARRRYDDVALYIFSDHGMTDITDLCDLKGAIEKTGFRFGTDYAAVYDSTMARFWFLRPGAREKIEECLRQEKRGHIMPPEEMHEFGCDFPDKRYGELFFLLDPGVLLCPSDMGEKPIKGMHGYTPRHADTFAMYASSEKLLAPPQRLDDMHRLMMSELED